MSTSSGRYNLTLRLRKKSLNCRILPPILPWQYFSRVIKNLDWRGCRIHNLANEDFLGKLRGREETRTKVLGRFETWVTKMWNTASIDRTQLPTRLTQVLTNSFLAPQFLFPIQYVWLSTQLQTITQSNSKQLKKLGKHKRKTQVWRWSGFTHRKSKVAVIIL